MNYTEAVFCAIVSLSLAACSETTVEQADVVPRGDRLLGVSISDRADGDFDSAFAQASAAGMQFTSLSVSWDLVESAPGVYGMNPDFIGIANSYYGSAGTKLLIGLNPIDTNNDRRPDHLKTLAWDSTELIDSYKSMLDWALPRLSGVELVALSVGNEIDATLSSPSEWGAYRTFLREVGGHARSLRPGLKVGSKVTYGGIIGSGVGPDSLNVESDLVLTTYYPLNSDFTIKSPSVVAGVFDSIVSRYPDHEIVFAEYGAPSSPSCSSSEARQADFVRAAFTAWDGYEEQIVGLEFTWMHDISQTALDTYEQYYGISDSCFLEYLGTLGMKSGSGENKQAWTALEQEASDRGW